MAFFLIVFPLVCYGLLFLNILRVKKLTGKNPVTVFKHGGLEEKLRTIGMFLWLFILLGFGSLLFLGWQPPLIFEREPWLSWLGSFFIILGGTGYEISVLSLGPVWRIGVDPGQKIILVEAGIYRHIRHPVYSAVFLLLMGTFLIFPHWFCLISLTAGSLGIFRQARLEEKFLEKTFGEKFLSHKNQTGMFLPKIFR